MERLNCGSKFLQTGSYIVYRLSFAGQFWINAVLLREILLRLPKITNRTVRMRTHSHTSIIFSARRGHSRPRNNEAAAAPSPI